MPLVKGTRLFQHTQDMFLQCRLASLDDLEPLQQLIKLTQLGIEGNACCNLHPVSRFRIEVLARHSANLQQIDSHKVGHDPLDCPTLFG